VAFLDPFPIAGIIKAATKGTSHIAHALISPISKPKISVAKDYAPNTPFMYGIILSKKISG